MFGLGCHVVRDHSIDLQFDSCHFEIGGIPGEIKNCEQGRRNGPKSRNLHINLECWQVCSNCEVAGREKKSNLRGS